MSIQRRQALEILSRPLKLIVAVFFGLVLTIFSQLGLPASQPGSLKSFSLSAAAAVTAIITTPQANQELQPQACGSPTNPVAPQGDTQDGSEEADLVVTKEVNNATPQEGETIVYAITITNEGPDDATGVVITDQLPAGVTYITHTVDRGIYDPVTGDWNGIKKIVAHCTPASLMITATVDPVTADRTIINVAKVLTLTQSDPITGNNADEAIITVDNPPPQADLEINVTVSKNVANMGDEVVFKITVTNNGPDTATGVVVTHTTLPSALKYVSHTRSQSYTRWTKRWVIPVLPPDKSIDLDIITTAQCGSDDQPKFVSFNLFPGAQQDPSANNPIIKTVTVTHTDCSIYLPVIFKDYPPIPCQVETFDDPNSPWHFDIKPGPPTLLEYLNGKYHMFTQDTSVSHWAMSGHQAFHNYSVEVDVRWTNPNFTSEGYGIVFDMFGRPPKTYYRFNINNDRLTGGYVLDKIEDNSRTRLISKPFSKGVLTGTVINTLKIKRNNHNIDLFINGEYQTSYSDSSNPLPRPGNAGVNIVPYDHRNGEVLFDNFSVCSDEIDRNFSNFLTTTSNKYNSGVGTK